MSDLCRYHPLLLIPPLPAPYTPCRHERSREGVSGGESIPLDEAEAEAGGGAMASEGQLQAAAYVPIGALTEVGPTEDTPVFSGAASRGVDEWSEIGHLPRPGCVCTTESHCILRSPTDDPLARAGGRWRR
jgi:hypothetical protein